MKTPLFIIILIVLHFNQSNGQQSECLSNESHLTNPSCNGIISTDPAFANNPSRSSMENQFDWRVQNFYVYHPTDYWGGSAGVPLLIANPFHTYDDHLLHYNYASFDFPDQIPSSLDFHPEDGWELIWKGNGYEVDEVTQLLPANNRIGPAMILYNKYTSTMRVFAAFEESEGEIMLTNVQHKVLEGTLVKTGIFNRYALIKPLDEPSDARPIMQASDATQGGGFFASEFKVNYDPCVCNYRSTLEFNFASKTIGQIYLEGRLVGTTVALDGSGQDPLQNGRNFLAAVRMDGFTVDGGALTYNNIDALVDKYEVNELSTAEKVGLTVLKEAIKYPSAQIDKYLGVASKVIGTKQGDLATLGSKVLQFASSVGIVGTLSQMFVTSLLKPNTIPNISVIEAEMALSGTVEHNTPMGEGKIEIAVPGSYETENPSIVPDRNYPLYNEALGVFAVLEKPKVKIKTTSTLNVCSTGLPGLQLTYALKFDDSAFKYFFNPAAQVNFEKTRIYGALEVKVEANATVNGQLNFVYQQNGISTYITDFYPIESLNRIAAEISANSCVTGFVSPEVTLKLQLFYEFLPNQYGKINHTWEVLKYPVNLVSTTESLTTDLPPENGTQSSTSVPIGKHVSNQLTMQGTFSSPFPTMYAKYSGGESVTAIANTTIGAGYILAAAPHGNVYADVKIPQQSVASVKSFCSPTGAYKAKNEAVRKKTNSAEVGKADEEFEHRLYVYPNPASSALNLEYELDENSPVQISILDLTGKLQSNVLNSFQEAGQHRVSTDISFLHEGLYLCTLQTNNYKVTKKLLIKKDR